MKATIIYSNHETQIVTARNAKSLSNKLYKLRIKVSEVDLIFMALTNGYSNVQSFTNRKTYFKPWRINIES